MHSVTIEQVDVTLISETDQVRMRNGFDKEAMDGLTASVRALGVMQPVTLRQEHTGYVVVYGHRRVAAARMAGLATVPAIIASDPGRHTTLIQLTENLQRENLALADQADALRKMADQLEPADKPLHVQIGKSKAWVSKRLAITSTRFPAELRSLVEDGKIEDAEMLGAMTKLRGMPDSAAAFARLVDQAKAGTLTRAGARAALQKFKDKEPAYDDDAAEGEGEGTETLPDGKVAVTFTLNPEQFEVFTRLGAQNWVRRMLKRETLKLEGKAK